MTETSIDWGEVAARSPDGIVCTDEARRILWANRAAERMLGRAPGELVGASLAEVMELGSDIGRALGAFESAHQSPVRTLGKRKDGSAIPLEVSLSQCATSPVTAAIVRDLSAQNRTLATDELKAERESFLSTAAHQLRAPVQPILTSLRTIERALATEKRPPPDTMARALRQALRLGRLVDAILSDATALERGEITVQTTPFDLASFTRDVVEDYRQAACDRRLEYRGPEGGLTIVSDEDRIHQILISLVDNALKYSAHERKVTVEVEASDTRARVRVIDEGIGIPAAEQARVFGKFYRGSNVPQASGGLGFGLYLAQGLAQRLHGTLSVASEVGRGSAFSLILPKQWPEADHGNHGSGSRIVRPEPPRTPTRRECHGHVRPQS